MAASKAAPYSFSRRSRCSSAFSASKALTLQLLQLLRRGPRRSGGFCLALQLKQVFGTGFEAQSQLLADCKLLLEVCEDLLALQQQRGDAGVGDGVGGRVVLVDALFDLVCELHDAVLDQSEALRDAGLEVLAGRGLGGFGEELCSELVDAEAVLDLMSRAYRVVAELLHEVVALAELVMSGYEDVGLGHAVGDLAEHEGGVVDVGLGRVHQCY